MNGGSAKMKEYSYQEQNNMENQLKIRQLLQELPDFTRTFFRGIEPRTSSRTRLGYGYDLRIFFEFLQEYNPSVPKWIYGIFRWRYWIR